MRLHMMLALLLVVPAAASAQNMNSEQFFRRGTALQAKGVMALFSGGEIKALMAEGQAAGKRAREGQRAAIKAGKPPRFCPPTEPIRMGNQEFMARLSAIPAGERSRIDMTEAMNRIMAVKYPCH